jgi:hypothetical protein
MVNRRISMAIAAARIFTPATLIAVALLAATPVATYFASRGVLAQGVTSTYESVTGTVIENGGSLAYSFKVGDETFTSSRDSYLPGRDTLAARTSLTVGAPVQVYYDPMHPRLCVLSPGTRYADFALAGLSFFGLPVLAGGVWFFSRRNRETGFSGNYSFSRAQAARSQPELRSKAA